MNNLLEYLILIVHRIKQSIIDLLKNKYIIILRIFNNIHNMY